MMGSTPLRPEQMRRVGRSEAAAVCFDWQSATDDAGEVETSEPMAARKRGLIQTTITAALGALIYTFISQHAGMIVMGIGGVLLTASILFPLSLYAKIESLVGRIAIALQRGITWLLMGLIFVSIFWPFARLFRRGHRDKLNRRIEPEWETYWNDRSDPITAESRRRLY